MKKRNRRGDPDEMPTDVAGLEGWTRARAGIAGAGRKLPSQRITINIDSDLIAIFKAEALRGGLPYQVAINQALREHLHRKEGEAGAEAVNAVLSALDDPAVRRKIRALARRA
jgi:uncharacterized protein (DUF4415 family)